MQFSFITPENDFSLSFVFFCCSSASYFYGSRTTLHQMWHEHNYTTSIRLRRTGAGAGVWSRFLMFILFIVRLFRIWASLSLSLVCFSWPRTPWNSSCVFFVNMKFIAMLLYTLSLRSSWHVSEDIAASFLIQQNGNCKISSRLRWDDVSEMMWMMRCGWWSTVIWDLINSINLRFFSLLFWGFGFEWESEIPQHNNSWSSKIWWGIENLILPHTHRMSMCHLADGTQVIDLKIQKNEIQIP